MSKAMLVIAVLFLFGCGEREYYSDYDCSMRSKEFEEAQLWECRTSSHNPGYCYGYYVRTFCEKREEAK